MLSDTVIILTLLMVISITAVVLSYLLYKSMRKVQTGPVASGLVGFDIANIDVINNIISRSNAEGVICELGHPKRDGSSHAQHMLRCMTIDESRAVCRLHSLRYDPVAKLFHGHAVMMNGHKFSLLDHGEFKVRCVTDNRAGKLPVITNIVTWDFCIHATKQKSKWGWKNKLCLN